MASIKLTELRPVGSELFHDSESFINELSDHEVPASLTGGGSSFDSWSTGGTGSWSTGGTGSWSTGGTGSWSTGGTGSWGSHY